MIALMWTAGTAGAASEQQSGGAILALFVIIVAISLWIALRAFVRGLRASKTQSATGGDYAEYALQALVNAAKIDGRVNDEERRAVAESMRVLAGEGFDAARVEKCFATATLDKTQLVAFLAARSAKFSRDQKVALLKALMTVFVADGKFDEIEHAALVDYTAAVGFDRQGAPEMLRGFVRGSIT